MKWHLQSFKLVYCTTLSIRHHLELLARISGDTINWKQREVIQGPYMIDRFVSITIVAILLRLINSIIIVHSLELFTSAIGRWFFTEVWVTASLLKSPRLFLVFWQFSTMLSFGWSPLVCQPPSPLVPLVIR